PSRGRHTSFSRDWSSDVCSSDLRLVELHAVDAGAAVVPRAGDGPVLFETQGVAVADVAVAGLAWERYRAGHRAPIGAGAMVAGRSEGGRGGGRWCGRWSECHGHS